MTNRIGQALGGGEIEGARNRWLHSDVVEASFDGQRLLMSQMCECPSEAAVEGGRRETGRECLHLCPHFEQSPAGFGSGVGLVLGDKFERLIDPLHDEPIKLKPICDAACSSASRMRSSEAATSAA